MISQDLGAMFSPLRVSNPRAFPQNLHFGFCECRQLREICLDEPSFKGGGGCFRFGDDVITGYFSGDF